MSGDSPVPTPGGLPTLHFPPELPISAGWRTSPPPSTRIQVVIVAGATGSGKTTQLPKIALAMGRGRPRQIGVTQPRRIAATSVAARVASELGTRAGHGRRLPDPLRGPHVPATYVKFMTDGILLAEIQGDPLLRRYDTIVIDEAHERSLTIDFLLGWLKRILPERPDLKVVVSSATIETERFSEFFGGAPVIQVEGRTFPVDVLYEPPPDDADLAEAVADAVANVTSLDPRRRHPRVPPRRARDPRDRERAAARASLRHTVVQPLYARLSAAEQAQGLREHPAAPGDPRHQRRRDVGHHPGHRLRRRHGRGAPVALRPALGHHAPADRGRSPRPAPTSARGAAAACATGICVRLYDEESFAARPGLHRSGDQAHRPRRRHPAHEVARPRRRRGLSVPRSAAAEGHHRGLPRARGARGARGQGARAHAARRTARALPGRPAHRRG